MDTKKSSTQDARIQNAFVPRADLGAAKTILRRDLLTGAALVLVGSASGCRKPPAPVPEPAPPLAPGSSACPAKLRTQFMADFTKKFIGDPTQILDPAPPPQQDPWPGSSRVWPATGQTPSSIANDYATFVNVLMTMGYLKQAAPAFPPGTLGAQIADFLQTQNWPAATAVPTEYQGELPTVRKVEIGVILDRLLQAMNSFESGASGGGSNWPPH